MNSRRPRRNRKSEAVRNLVEETQVSVKDLIFALFLVEGRDQESEVA